MTWANRRCLDYISISFLYPWLTTLCHSNTLIEYGAHRCKSQCHIIRSYKHSRSNSSFVHSWRISSTAILFNLHSCGKKKKKSQLQFFKSNSNFPFPHDLYIGQLLFCLFSHIYATLLELITPVLEPEDVPEIRITFFDFFSFSVFMPILLHLPILPWF